MDPSVGFSRQGHRLLQGGVLLFLLALLVGLGVPRFAVPRLGLSTHLLGITQGVFLMVIGLLWPRLALSTVLSRVACGLALYGCFAAWSANLLAATWGSGSSLLPMAAGPARGSALQEAVIGVGLRTAALSLIAATVLVLWGLRASARPAGDQSP
jgi:hydroxylaminobenzene mutase